jgi:catalase
MNLSFAKIRKPAVGAALLAAGALVIGGAYGARGQEGNKDLAHQIFDVMVQIQGNIQGRRLVHAKGIVCEGTFTPTKIASSLSKAAQFQASSSPVTIRFSDGSFNPAIPDNSPDAGPRGMAIRFKPAGAEETDIVAMSHNGFVVGTGEEFLALQKAVAATDPSKPHPWPVEEFISTHPLALKFVQENRIVPASFANESFFSNDSFLFVNQKGTKQAGRYKILPVAGQKHLSEAEAKDRPADFLVSDLKSRLAKGPVKFRVVVQLPNPGDPTKDPSLVWPENRKTVDVGVISVTSVVADNDAAEKALAFDPTRLADGIELSDDPLPALRSKVYALSVKHRREKEQAASR